jgi:hypothetical protein
MAALGQLLFLPPSVKSRPGNQHWLTASTLAIRYRLADALLGGPAPGKSQSRFDAAGLFSDGIPTDPAALIDALIERLLVANVAPVTREVLLAACHAVAAVQRPLRVVRLVLAMPEYQLA